MVGVPGRSKACHTCRSRRKGCDQKRPSCGQCTLSRTPCGGYDQRLIFVNSGFAYGGKREALECFKAPTYTTANTFSPARAQSRVSELSRLTPSFAQKSFDYTARECKYLEVYWTSLLPHGRMFPSEAARYSTTSWTKAIQDIYYQDPLVRVVLLSNALTLAAEQAPHERISLDVQARRLYGLSLQMVAQSLLHQKRQDFARLLAAAGLLASYELLLNNGERHPWLPAPTWRRHTSGEIAIILAGGSESFVDGYAHQLLVDHRLHLVYPYIRNRKRCPLNSVEWKTIPWSTHSKSPKDELVDILLEIPGILEDIGALETVFDHPDGRYPLYEALEERCWQCDRDLQSWSNSSGQTSVAFVEYLTAVEGLDANRCGDEKAPSGTELAIAHLGLLYWTTYNLLSQALAWLREAKPPQNGPVAAQLPPYIDAHLYCRKVALLVPFFQRPGVGLYFISFVGFPVSVAANFLSQQGSQEFLSEARALLNLAFQGEHGKQLQRFLKSWPSTKMSESRTLEMEETQVTMG